MRIPSDSIKTSPVASVAAVKRTQATESFGATPTEPSIKVSVSPEARARSAGAPEERPVDMQKVERLRALVERGELAIDPARIADRILTSES
jgi:flagellar biosynthesis anti-sigma factor FlgM